jgi:flagellar hook-basal body complex protein FliE
LIRSKNAAKRKKKIFEEKYDEIYAEFKKSVLEKIEFSKESEIINKGRDALIEVQNQFKEMNLKRDHREEVVKLLDEAFDHLNQKQAEERERYEMECIENYHNLKAIVDEALEFFQNSDNLRDVRLKLIEAQNSFKGLVLKKEQREEQFDRIQKAFDILNEKQAAEREEFEQEAEENYSKLKIVIDEAIEFSKNAEIFKDARQKLIQAQKEIRGKKLRKIQRDNLYGAIREAFEQLNKRPG